MKGDESPKQKEKQIVAKLSSQENEQNELTIDEEFFHSWVLSGIWQICASKLPQEFIAVFQLLVALKAGVKKQALNENQFTFFLKYFFTDDSALHWKVEKIFCKKEYPSITESRLLQFKAQLEQGNIFTLELQNALKLISQKVLSAQKEQRKQLLEDLLKKDLKQLPLFSKIVLSLIGFKTNLKSRVQQFIHQELNSIFDFADDFTKFYNFIKLCSWKLPVAIFSENSVNVINTICSIASYYNVELIVIEEDQASTTQKYKQILQSAAIKGTWVLISMTEFPQGWKECHRLLQELEQENEIMNSFRIMFDFQNTSVENIPAEFLIKRSVSFQITNSNMEDMEGLNDVWAHILNDNILQSIDNTSAFFDKSERTFRNETSSCFENSFLKESIQRLDVFSKIPNTKYLNNLSVNSIQYIQKQINENEQIQNQFKMDIFAEKIGNVSEIQQESEEKTQLNQESIFGSLLKFM